ncbi:MAG: MerR family transcriptional regulator [Chitinivibrionales bacterium]|nr:MerR family transcriptional regulator [Chitinivibrionales bacterium]
MVISEVMHETGLTKKAINYYVGLGLVHPVACENNKYRDFSADDVKKLKIVAALRQIDVPLDRMKALFEGELSIHDVLREQLSLTQEKIGKYRCDEIIITSFLQNNHGRTCGQIDDSAYILLREALEMNAMKRIDFVVRQLQRIFPGVTGRFFGATIGAMVKVPVDSEEKRRAWLQLVQRLDEQESIDIPQDVEEYMEKMIAIMGNQGGDSYDTIDAMVDRSRTSLERLATDEGVCADLEGLKQVFQTCSAEVLARVNEEMKHHRAMQERIADLMKHTTKPFERQFHDIIFTLDPAAEKALKHLEIINTAIAPYLET